MKRKLLDASCTILGAAVIARLAIWAVPMHLPQNFQRDTNAVLLISLAVAASIAISLLIERIRPPKRGWEYLTVTLAVFFVVLTTIYLAWDVWDRTHPDTRGVPHLRSDQVEAQPK